MGRKLQVVTSAIAIQANVPSNPENLELSLTLPLYPEGPTLPAWVIPR